MIFLNGVEINQNHFSDGALDLKVNYDILRLDAENVIEWLFDNNEELVSVYFLVKHLRSKGIEKIVLKMPYIPNARRDRVRDENNVFTLKYFAEIINGLVFTRVEVLDPHSMTSEALIDRIRIAGPESKIIKVMDEVGVAALFYPDEGAVKRYADVIGRPFVYGVKSRDKSRQIKTLRIEGNTELVRGKNVLMIDDICGSGTTLLRSIKELKELGVKDVYVYVSHCENTVLNNTELLDLVAGIYTTNDIYRSSHPKIHVMGWCD